MMAGTSRTTRQVSAIVVNYKSAVHVDRCITALQHQQGIDLEIIVVDNDSGPEDRVRLSSLHTVDNISLIFNQDNLGFGRANNIGAAQARGDFLLLINPDAEFVRPHDLEQLCTCIETGANIGMVGPEIIEPGKNKHVMPKMHYPSVELLRQRTAFASLPGDIAWLLGACLLIRRDTFMTLGGFDEDYFLYGEDVDLCLRVRKAGLQLGHCPTASINHVGGASAATIFSLEKFLLKKRGYLLFCQKHYGRHDVYRIAHRMKLSARIKLLALRVRKFLGVITDHEFSRQLPKWQAEYQASRELLATLSSKNETGTI